MGKTTQCEFILTTMLQHREKAYWTAKDFQKPPYFVGYEASARMSDLMRMHPDLLIVGREDRFRTLAINWEKYDELERLGKEIQCTKSVPSAEH